MNITHGKIPRNTTEINDFKNKSKIITKKPCILKYF